MLPDSFAASWRIDRASAAASPRVRWQAGVGANQQKHQKRLPGRGGKAGYFALRSGCCGLEMLGGGQEGGED